MHHRARRARAAHAIAVALALCAIAAPAAGQVSRPSASRRIVKVWDFEDREVHGLDLPEHWSRYQSVADFRLPDGTVVTGTAREGFPPWNQAAYSSADAASGKWSMALPTIGGSTALVFDAAALPVLPMADYEVACMIRTDRLVHARTRVVATLVDAAGAPIEGSRFASEPIISPDGWTRVSVLVRGSALAASMRLELELLQPQTLAGLSDPIAPDGIAWPEDFAGVALFDDLSIEQRPRIRLTTGHPGNIIADGRSPVLRLRARDTTGDLLTAFLEVRDIRGGLVDSATKSLEPTWTPVLWVPEVSRYGWYQMTVRVVGPDGDVGTAEAAFVWTEPAPEGVAACPLGIVLGGLDPDWSPLAPGLVRASGASHVHIPIHWGLDDSAPALLALTDRILDDGVGVSMVIDDANDPVDGLMAALNEPSNPANAARIDRLLPLLTRFGERVSHWQVGDHPAVWAGSAESDAMSSKALDLLRRYVPRPVVALPWDMHARPPAWQAEGRTLVPHLPSWTPADACAEYVEAWRDLRSDASVPVVVDVVDPAVAGMAWSAVDLAQRAIHAWTAGAGPILIEQPWDLVGVGDGLEPVATPHLAVWRALATRLDGLAYVGAYPAPPGVVAVFGRRPGAGTLILWSRRPDHTAFTAQLGASELSAFDLFGNAVPIERTPDGVRIPLTSAPVFIEGIDGELAAFLASLRIEPTRLSVSAERQPAEVVVSNPWLTSASIRVRVVSPETWEAVPRVLRATVRPGESERLELSLQIGIGEVAGPRSIELEVAITADREYPAFNVTLPIDLGMPGIHVLPLYSITPDGSLVVELLVTNTSSEPIGLDLIARVPGRPTIESPMAAVAPAQSLLRSFVFPEASELIGADARLSLRRRDWTHRLNLVVPIR